MIEYIKDFKLKILLFFHRNKIFKKLLSAVEFLFIAFITDKVIKNISSSNYDGLSSILEVIFKSIKTKLIDLKDIDNKGLFYLVLATLFVYFPYKFYKSKIVYLMGQIAEQTKRAKKELNKQIDITINQLLKEDINTIKKRDKQYHNILNSAKAEFQLEGVDSLTISKCIEELNELVNNPKITIQKVYALTDFSSSSWTTRLMLYYLFKTIQLATKVTKIDDKKRIYLIQDNEWDDQSFKEIENLHKGFMKVEQIKESVFNNTIKKNNLLVPEKKAFLYISYLYNKNPQEKIYHYHHSNNNNNTTLWLGSNNVNIKYRTLIDNFF